MFVEPFWFLLLTFLQGRRWEMEDSHIVADNAFKFWEQLAEDLEGKGMMKRKKKD